MAADSLSKFRKLVLRGASVQTEFGEFSVRTYERYEGRNPRTGELVIVLAKHQLFLRLADAFGNDVLDRSRPLQAPTRSRASPHISFADDYVEIVAQLRRKKVTTVRDPDAWADTVPKEPVLWHDLGWFAVFRGPDHDEPAVRTAVVFRPSDEIIAALGAALGE
jgi:Bacterial DNA-binding protein